MSETLLAPITALPPDAGSHLAAAAKRIAPLWPLDRFVAVNPYFGMADLPFDEAADLLADTVGTRTTMSAGYYLDLIDRGVITSEDLSAGIRDLDRGGTVEQLLERCRSAASEPSPAWQRVPTVATVATATSGADWASFMRDRVSAWAGSYFDVGQASWSSVDATMSPFESWREEASIDRTPEVMGLKGFRRFVRSLPAAPLDAAVSALSALSLPDDQIVDHLHALMLSVGGWSAHCARIEFEAGLRGLDDHSLIEFQSVLLCWEAALLATVPGVDLGREWHDAVAGSVVGAGRFRPAERWDEMVLQDAFDRAEQRRLIGKLSSGAGSERSTGRPDVQAVFCIDVRSEVLRRHLETAEVETFGFAGFFGAAIDVVPLGHAGSSAQYPVLLTAGATVVETLPDPDRLQRAVAGRRLAHHVHRAWKSFKMGAISCFSFVGPVGLAYLPKLFTDGFGLTRPVERAGSESLDRWADAHRFPGLEPGRVDGIEVGIEVASRVDLAATALRAMSLPDQLAPLVLLVGHGASTVNNPYDSGLHCGACGGNTGEANARVMVAILNDPEVRDRLVDRGVEIPADTWFLAGLHDTTTDRVTVFDTEAVPARHRGGLTALDARLRIAGHLTRAERAQRMGIDDGDDVDTTVIRRSTDWAQVRPEWALAGCSAFIAAPRHRTRDLDLRGRSFLHSYDWRRDEGFTVLELILTAPVVVASWINLQYFGSTVAPDVFGSGNKTLHNVVGRLGVLEGTAGDLRVGLPWQSVHDGVDYQHDPLRLSVVVEAPIEAMTAVLERNDHIRDLCDNRWVYLFAMGDDGQITHRYSGSGAWDEL